MGNGKWEIAGEIGKAQLRCIELLFPFLRNYFPENKK